MKNDTDVVEFIANHSNDDHNGTFAGVMAKAVNAKAESSAKNAHEHVNGSLPDIVEVEPLSEEEIACAAEEAKKKKEWVEQAGAMLLKLKEERDSIQSIDGWDLLPKLVSRVNKLTSMIEELESAGDENIHRHLEFSEFLNFIREVKTEHQMDYVVKRLVSESVNTDGATRYRAVSKDEVHRRRSSGTYPKFAFFWKGSCYFPYEPASDEMKSDGQKAVEYEVMKAILRLSLKKKKGIMKKTEALRSMDASSDLSGMLKGVVGLYLIEAEPIRDNDNKKKIVRHGGVAVVRLCDNKRIEPVDGAGCFHWLSGEDGKWWISVGNAILGKVPWDPRKDETAEDRARRVEKWAFMPYEHKDKARRLARVLHNILHPIHVKQKA